MSDYVEDRLPGHQPKVTARDKRLESVRRLTGLTADELEALGRGDLAYQGVARKLVAWQKQYGTDYQGARRLAELIEAGQVRSLAVGVVPHWQRALDAKFEALGLLEKIHQTTSQAERVSAYFPESTDLQDPAAVKDVLRRAQEQVTDREVLHYQDMQALRAAETYSFNQETTDAIMAAAQSLPHDAPLSSVETPNTGAGWFWFQVPLPVATTPAASPGTAALLWSWVDGGYSFRPHGPAIRFSAYVVDESSGVLHGKVLPSTLWFWSFDRTFHEMLADNEQAYHETYGNGGPYQDAPDRATGLDATRRVIAELSLFFLAACVWFKQKILVAAPGHIERHARKRLQKEHKLADAPSVQVIALRAVAREPSASVPGEQGEGASRHYTCRWIVSGHARLQPVGPGRKERKLIWVDPYPKGPENMPLKTRQRVYAVVR